MDILKNRLEAILKNKQLLSLSIIFLCLFTVLIIKKALIKPQVERFEYRNINIAINPDEIFVIEAVKKTVGKEEKLKFEKKDGGDWLITSQWNLGADRQKIENLMKDISNLKGELRSRSEELFSDYGISIDKAFSIDFVDKDGVSKQKIFVGTEKAGGEKSFLRKGDSSDVYIVDKDIYYMFGMYGKAEDSVLNADMWVDLSIAKYDPEKIDSIRITRQEEGLKTVTVDVKRELDENKNLKQWVSQGEGAVFNIDAAKIKDYLNRIITTRAAKAVDPAAVDYGFASPFLTINFASEGAPIDLIVGKEENENTNDRYIKAPEGRVYLLKRYGINNIDIDISRFFIDNPLEINKDKLESIKIKAKEKAVDLDKDRISLNTDYINELSRFSVEKILFTKILKAPDYSIEVKKDDGTSLVLYAKIEKAGDKEEYISQLSGYNTIFSINKNIFDKLFGELDKIKLENETESAAVQR